MQKAPDTRNKLDDNKDLKKKVKISNISKSGKEFSEKFYSPKKEGEIVKSPLKLKKGKKPSKGELYKQHYGHSKSIRRAMLNNHITPSITGSMEEDVEQYKAIRKAKKAQAKKIRQKKHADSVVFKRTNKKSGKSGKSTEKSKAVATK